MDEHLISPEEAKQAFDSGRALLLDVRSTDAYRAAHIRGALGVPLERLPRRLAELPRDRLLVPY